MGTQVPLRKGHTPSIFGQYLLWPNGSMDQDATWQEGRPRPKRHRVRWGPSSPSPKREQPPIFGPCLLCPNGWMDQDATWWGGRPRPKRHCVGWRTSSHFPKRGQTPPQFSAHVYCDETTVWIKIPRGMEVGLSVRDFELDGDPALLLKKGAHQCHHPIFGLCLLCPNGWMDQDATWYGGRPRPKRRCVRWGPSSPSRIKRGGVNPLIFGGPCLLRPNGRPSQLLLSTCLAYI